MPLRRHACLCDRPQRSEEMDMLTGFLIGAIAFGGGAALLLTRTWKRLGAREMGHREFNTTIW
jgi:hypothetical protein